MRALVLLLLVAGGCHRGDSLVVVTVSGSYAGVQQLGVVITAANLPPASSVKKIDLGYPSVTLPTTFAVEMPSSYVGQVRVDVGAIAATDQHLMADGSVVVSVAPGNEYSTTIALDAVPLPDMTFHPEDLSFVVPDGYVELEPNDMGVIVIVVGGDHDMATPKSIDMAKPDDMMKVAVGPDMTIIGKPCSADSQCDPAHKVGCDQTGHCNMCGYSLDALCCTGMSCSFLNGNPSVAAAYSCQAGESGGPPVNWCQPCGGFTQPCCSGATTCQNPYTCQSGTCQN